MAIRGNQGPSREIAPDVKVEAERIGSDVIRARTEQLWGNCAHREAREHEPARSDLEVIRGHQRSSEVIRGHQRARACEIRSRSPRGTCAAPSRARPAAATACTCHVGAGQRSDFPTTLRHSDGTPTPLRRHSPRNVLEPHKGGPSVVISGHQWSSAAHRSTMYWNPTRAGLPTAAEYSLASSLRASMPSEAVRRTLTKPVRRIYHASRHRFGGATG